MMPLYFFLNQYMALLSADSVWIQCNLSWASQQCWNLIYHIEVQPVETDVQGIFVAQINIFLDSKTNISSIWAFIFITHHAAPSDLSLGFLLPWSQGLCMNSPFMHSPFMHSPFFSPDAKGHDSLYSFGKYMHLNSEQLLNLGCLG